MKYRIPVWRTATKYGHAIIEAPSPAKAVKYLRMGLEAEITWEDDLDWDDEIGHPGEDHELTDLEAQGEGVEIVEVLVIDRHVFSFNEPGQEGKPVKVDRSRMISAYPPGTKYVVDAAAPGIGRVIYEITRHDRKGAWGIELENTIREAQPEEVM